MGKRTPQNPYGLDLSFLAIAKQLDSYQDIARKVAGQMTVVDQPGRLIASLAVLPAYDVAEQAYRASVSLMASQSAVASRSIVADLAERHRAIAASMVPANALAGLEQSLLQSVAPYQSLVVEAARQFASARLQIDVSQLQSLLVGALPAFLDQGYPAPTYAGSPYPDDLTADPDANAVREAVSSHAELVFWLAMLLLVTWFASYLVGADVGEGNELQAMRDSVGGLGLIMWLADKVRRNLPPS